MSNSPQEPNFDMASANPWEADPLEIGFPRIQGPPMPMPVLIRRQTPKWTDEELEARRLELSLTWGGVRSF